jgi:hypothetical protein
VRRLVGELDHPDPGAKLKELDPPKELDEQIRKLVLGVDVSRLEVPFLQAGGGLTPYRPSFYAAHCTLFFQLGTHVVLLRTLLSSLETLQYHTPTLMIWKLLRDCRMTFK